MSRSQSIGILIPIYNDWLSCARLLVDLDTALGTSGLEASVVIVDDGSTLPNGGSLTGLRRLPHIRSIEIVQLAYNMGHQRAIAIGLAYVSEKHAYDLLLVMDGDGEDSPLDVVRLIEAQQGGSPVITFAKRGRRSESLVFRVSYAAYRILFRMLTGRVIQFGNFCLIPRPYLARVAQLPLVWTHLASGIMRSGLPIRSLPTDRGLRYAGQSKMNLVSLIMHGLAALSVYLDVLTVRLILLTSATILLGVLGFGILLYIRYLTPLAIPGWATTVALGLSLIILQSFLILGFLSFVFLNSRTQSPPIPARGYTDCIFSIEAIRTHG